MGKEKIRRSPHDIGARNRKWRAYRRYEAGRNADYLKRLSEGEGLGILRGLYAAVADISRCTNLDGSDKVRIEGLARVHAIFGRVRA